MRNVTSWKKALACFLSFLFVAMTSVTSAAAQAVVPVNATRPTLIPVTIDNSGGDQTDPHVSGDWVAYTSDLAIRYYNFASNVDAQIPLGLSVHDLLSDISGSKIVFSRIINAVKSAVMLFDAATPLSAPIEVDPAAASTRLGAAIGGNTVAYIDFDLHPNGELVIHDLITSISVRITNDTAFDQNPSVSPNGEVVVWEHCAISMTNCDIWQAAKSGSVWSVSVVADSPSPESNPDTNGTLIVYDSQRGLNPDLFWRPVGGGGEVQLLLPGLEHNASIAGNFIAFESRATFVDAIDIYVYDMVGNRVYQITTTPLVNEQLNDITLFPNGNLGVVWASDEDGVDQRNIHAATFSPLNSRVASSSAPVANAGPDQTVAVGAMVTLNGSGSTDPSNPLTFAWTLLSRPAGSVAALSNSTAVQPTFVADRAGSYVAQLIVNNGTENSAPDTVIINTSNSCDADHDNDIDMSDLQLIRDANGQVAAAGDPRDGNGDGRINVADARYCQLRLTSTTAQ